MTFLPIVARELRVSSRRRGTYWVRSGTALVALIVGGWIMLIPKIASPAELGLILFVSLSAFLLCYCTLAGARTTADILAGEKREGTLGLLFLTDLRGYDIVLGKLAATSLNVIYGMIAVLPVLSLALLIGGVTAAEFGRIALVAGNNLFFSLSVGIFASAVSRAERAATVLCLAIVLLLAVGLPMLGGLIAAKLNTTSHLAPFLIPSPGYTGFIAFEFTYQNLTGFKFFWPSLGCVHGLAWLFLALACVIVPRTWQDRPERRAIDTRALTAGGAPPVISVKRDPFRTRLLERNPFHWLAARARWRSVQPWLFLAVCAGFWIWGWAENRRSWAEEPILLLTSFTLHVAFKFWVASEACRRFIEDRRSGALELILSTPLSVRQILGGQLAALLGRFGLPVLVVILADLAMISSSDTNRDTREILAVMLGAFLVDLVAMAWTAMWLGLKSRDANRATGGTAGRVLLLPWIAFAAVATVVELSGGNWSGSATIWWLGLSVANAVFHFAWAWRRLMGQFRVAVSERFAKRGKA
jgi:ABC-type Na+ efflux pump permease subunit